MRRWLWRSYVRAAIIPLLVVEVGFLLIYWLSNTIVHQENVSAIGAVSQSYLADVAGREAEAIGRELSGYASGADILARQSARALEGPAAPGGRRPDLVFDPDGSIYTRADTGGTASFWSNRHRPGPADVARMEKLAVIDPLLLDLQKSMPDVLSVYFNSRRSYNRIYPWIDAGQQYPHDMDIPSYNFYYLADASHNRARKPVWTDAYVDPAGHGWMVSVVAPVWARGQLEGVVGIDIGLSAVIDRLMRLRLPWGAYAVLVDRDGRIIALPPTGERDFGLRELTAHSYSSAIEGDRLKPDSFVLDRHPALRPLAAAMKSGGRGHAALQFDGAHQAAFATVPGPGWRLVVIASAEAVNAPADRLAARFRLVGFAMLGGLLLFYAGFFVVLWRRAREMSGRVARPLGQITELMGRIGAGEYHQDFAGAEVTELDELGRRLVSAGAELGEAHAALGTALERQQQVNEQNARLVAIMSHELRTPLSVIESGAQIIDRKAESLNPADLRRRSSRTRTAVRRISDLLDKLVDSLKPGDADEPMPIRRVDLAATVRKMAETHLPTSELVLDLAAAVNVLAYPPALDAALTAIFDNAARYGMAAQPITVTVFRLEGEGLVTVENAVEGLADADIGSIGKLFWRGAATVSIAGAGVSLHLARRQLEECGGRIHVARTSTGLRVSVALPLAPSHSSN